jgi:hypothetical protein
MVPGSTFKYGSSFLSRTEKPLAWSSAPNDAEVSPFPREDTTPPVMKINLANIYLSKELGISLF